MAKLHFYYSAMNAGKSTVLLQSSYNYQERGMDTLLYTSSLDTRFGKGKIASRLGLQAPAITVDSDFNIYTNAEKAITTNPNIRCVLVDEAHFLTKAQVKQLCDITDFLDVPVLAYALRTDFQTEPFEGSLYLMAWADLIIEIKTICHCGKKATMTLRIDAEGKPIRSGAKVEIGGNERYVSVCRKHHKLGVTASERPVSADK
ncbi:MAG: thymidine kinase [Coxiellaceae bacterium]|nr:MAG: thymidine kinase [Coxiellaceae bacterium]